VYYWFYTIEKKLDNNYKISLYILFLLLSSRYKIQILFHSLTIYFLSFYCKKYRFLSYKFETHIFLFSLAKKRRDLVPKTSLLASLLLRWLLYVKYWQIFSDVGSSYSKITDIIFSGYGPAQINYPFKHV